MAEKKCIQITEDDFYDRYNPVKNHLVKDAAFDGCMFETYGIEEEYIRNYPKSPITPRQIWTIVEAEGIMYYVSGWHYVDRVGYLITEEMVPEGTEIEVKLDNNTEE
jgi:hypothetical protein